MAGPAASSPTELTGPPAVRAGALRPPALKPPSSQLLLSDDSILEILLCKFCGRLMDPGTIPEHEDEWEPDLQPGCVLCSEYESLVLRIIRADRKWEQRRHKPPGHRLRKMAARRWESARIMYGNFVLEVDADWQASSEDEGLSGDSDADEDSTGDAEADEDTTVEEQESLGTKRQREPSSDSDADATAPPQPKRPRLDENQTSDPSASNAVDPIPENPPRIRVRFDHTQEIHTLDDSPSDESSLEIRFNELEESIAN